MMQMPTGPSTQDRGLTAFRASLRPQDVRSELWQRLMAAIEDERTMMRAQNDSDMNIAETTLLRGQLRLASRILALADEVGPESRQSELEKPESASSPLGDNDPVERFLNEK
jgi:hypothetical protein